jgi:hypothetical protein
MFMHLFQLGTLRIFGGKPREEVLKIQPERAKASCKRQTENFRACSDP